MGFPTPDEDTVEASQRAILQFEHDREVRIRRRIELTHETGYQYGPGFF